MGRGCVPVGGNLGFRVSPKDTLIYKQEGLEIKLSNMNLVDNLIYHLS